MGGRECHDVIAKGEVWLSRGPEGLEVMRCVVCLPSMTGNLLPRHPATKGGYVCYQADTPCTMADMADKARVWPRGMKQKRLYRLDCRMMHASAEHEGYANVSSEAVSTRIWHSRFGHPGRQALMAVLAETNLDSVVPHELDRVRGVCMCAKVAREPFLCFAKNAEGALDLLHTDVMDHSR